MQAQGDPAGLVLEWSTHLHIHSVGCVCSCGQQSRRVGLPTDMCGSALQDLQAGSVYDVSCRHHAELIGLLVSSFLCNVGNMVSGLWVARQPTQLCSPMILLPFRS
jgi:hypothetical protein